MPKLIFTNFDIIRKMYFSFDPVEGTVTQIFENLRNAW